MGTHVDRLLKYAKMGKCGRYYFVFKRKMILNADYVCSSGVPALNRRWQVLIFILLYNSMTLNVIFFKTI